MLLLLSSSLLLPLETLTLNLTSSMSTMATAVPFKLSVTEATPEQMDDAIFTASPCCTSTPKESARGRRNRPRRPIPSRSGRRCSSSRSSLPRLLRPPRTLHYLPGESAVQKDILLLPLSLS